MATHSQESFSTQSHNLQEDSPELDQRIAQSGRNNVIQNISNLRIDGGATFSDLQIHQFILDIKTKIIEALEQLDEISGNINAIASYWKIPDTASELRDLRKDIDFYKKTLESYNSKLTKIKSSSENLYLLLKRMLGIRIPQMSDIRFPPPISLTRVVIESVLESNGPQSGESTVGLIIWELGNHFARCKFYEKQFLAAGCQIANIAYKIGSTVYKEYKSQSDAKEKISEVKIQFIRCTLKEKLERINKFFDRAIAESEDSLKAAMDQTLMQVKEAIRTEKEIHPRKSEIDIITEMRKISFCAGFILPLKNALDCNSDLVWELILDLFQKPRPHSAVEAHSQTL